MSGTDEHIETTSAGPDGAGTVTRLATMPSPGALYGQVARRAAREATLGRLPRRRTVDDHVPELPDRTLEVTGVRADTGRHASYQHLLGDTVGDRLSPGFVHVTAFPLALAAMTASDFPLPAAGLVHVHNVIDQRQALSADDALRVRARTTDLRPHPKGTQVDVVTEVWADEPGAVDEPPAWRGRSTYLARGVRLPDSGRGDEPDVHLDPALQAMDGTPLPDHPSARWRLPGDTGRRYAAVSGDVNPIHLGSLPARAFGFRRAIAHGMYTAARALAALPERRSPALTWSVGFGSPVYLPSTVALAIGRPSDASDPADPADPSDAHATRGVVWSPAEGRVHLRFVVRPGEPGTPEVSA